VKAAGSGRKVVIGLVLGAVLVAAAGAGLVWRGDLQVGQDGSADVSALEARLASLEAQSEQDRSAKTRALSDLSSKVTSLEGAIEAGEEQAGGASAQQLQDIQRDFDALKAKLSQIENSPGAESQLSQSDLALARQEIENMQRAIQGVSSHVEAVGRSLAENDVRIESLEENAPPEDLDNILNSLSAKSDVAALGSRLAGLERYNSIDAAEKATIALAAADLTRAAKGSAPFVAELDAFSIAAPGENAARELRSYAVTGVATKEVLLGQFQELVRRAIDQEKRAKGVGWFGRSWASFLTTFDVRKVGEVEGTTTKAILARAEQRVLAGDLTAAAKELGGLEGAAAEVMKPWGQQIAARERVDALTAKLNARVFKALNKALDAAGEN
jgi:hypothetical protein